MILFAKTEKFITFVVLFALNKIIHFNFYYYKV
jgi:hypothetical protein